MVSVVGCDGTARHGPGLATDQEVAGSNPAERTHKAAGQSTSEAIRLIAAGA